jgi:hypothetical protein
MFDRRPNTWITVNAYLFNGFFDDNLQIEVEVNPEFGSVEAARSEALKYLHAIGQLPTASRQDIHTIWLHQGVQPFGGGNNNLLIYSGQAQDYINSGILEETFMHESTHSSLDGRYSNLPGWLAAQRNDPEFISTYARDNPTREDMAESFLLYFAIRYRPDRISETVRDTIMQSIPNRIAYFDSLNLNMNPTVPPPPFALYQPSFDPVSGELQLTWNSRPGQLYNIESTTSLEDASSWTTLSSSLPSEGSQTSCLLPRASLDACQFFRVHLIN